MLWLFPPVVALAFVVALGVLVHRRETRALAAAESGLQRVRRSERRLARRLPRTSTAPPSALS